ncbi:MAG: iron-sulfur cluster assembly accessory protein [Pirellulaceae bacterium]|jgi:iron-sulfur cluster assembly protein|nr:iron-sulfur cluster assembly accessory protein [Pirellulaceae bacterium]
MSVVLTEKAANEVKKFITDGSYGEEAVLRIAVVGGGCSGLSYSLNIATDYDAEKDTKSDQHGVPVVVDRKSALYLDGTSVDYYEDLDKRGFQFINPHVKRSCGCGNSFSV